MKQLLLLHLILFSACSFSMQKSEGGLSAQEALDKMRENIDLLDSASSINPSLTPLLDHYKCAFILGWLKPSGKEKLYRKISEEDLGALAAQKKHLGKTLTLQEEIALGKWHAYITKKYNSQHSQELVN